MKKKSLSVLIAVAMATTTFAPSAVAFADEKVAVTDTANAEEEVKEAPASTYGVTYDTHIQKRGWNKSVKTVTGDEADITKFTDAGTSGTIGKALRVEAIRISGTNLPEGASIEYKVHQQTFGWSKVAKDGAEAGVTGKGKRAEAIKVTLKGLPGYAIKYQVHVQKKGWMDPVVTENGTDIDAATVAGTEGQSLRIEALRVQIVKTDAEKKAEVEALNAVALAEAAKDEASIEAAKAAVAKVQDVKQNEEMNERISAIEIQDVTPEEKEAREAVDKLVEAANGDLTTEEAIKAAEDLVTPAEEAVVKVQDEDVKTELSAKIENAQNLIKSAKALLNQVIVESISAITTDGVDIAITPLTENRDGVTVDVVDGKGNEIAVEAQDVLAGVTTLNFKFKKPVKTEDLDGVWTVNGVEYNFTEIKLVNDINVAVTNENQVDLLKALNAAGIENVNEDKIGDYLTQIKSSSTKSTIADIQKVVDDTNKSAEEEKAEEVLVSSVKNAKTQVAILSILKDNFERVNPDWIVKYTSGDSDSAGIKIVQQGDNVIYKDASNTTGTTKADIQEAIDAVNEAMITYLDSVATTSTDQAKVTDLIKSWVKDDVAPATAKADEIKGSQIKEAVFKVQEANTENSLYSALIGLANVDSTNLKVSELNAKLAPTYLKTKNQILSANYGTKLNNTANIKINIVDATDTSALIEAMTDVTDKYASVNSAPSDTTKLAEFKDSLQKVADVTSHKNGTDKFDMSIVKDQNLVKYAVAFNEVTKITNGSSVVDLVTKINAINDQEGLDNALKTINDTKSTITQVKDALLEIAIARNTGSSATNAAGFIDLTAQARLEVAELVQKDRVKAGTDYSDLDAIIASDDGSGILIDSMTAHSDRLKEFNKIGDLASGKVTTTKSALDKYENDEYMALTTTQKLAVVEEINKLVHIAADGTKTPYNFGAADAVKTFSEADTIIDTAIKSIK